MTTYTKYLTFNTRQEHEYINITLEVAEAIEESGVKDGLVYVGSMHITSSVYINDAEDGLLQDIETWLEKLAPARPDYKHHRTGETNGDAHLKNLIMGHSVTCPITRGRLDFGPWQQIYYAEFDGQRPKRLIIKVMGE
ncbi:MAG: secondary thiamine-phosphate synthase enzyme YjbQ [Chloroflexota bacterium]|nr:YjbQ family protein [Chloroflexota bacterium]